MLELKWLRIRYIHTHTHVTQITDIAYRVKQNTHNDCQGNDNERFDPRLAPGRTAPDDPAKPPAALHPLTLCRQCRSALRTPTDDLFEARRHGTSRNARGCMSAGVHRSEHRAHPLCCAQVSGALGTHHKN